MRLRLLAPLIALLALTAACGGNATYEVGQQYYPPQPAATTSTSPSSSATPSTTPPPASSGSGSSTPAPSPLAKYLTVSTASKTVTLTLIAGLKTSPSPFNFDGTLNGQMVVSVPAGWTLKVNLQNQGVLPHSAAVVASSTSVVPVSKSAATPNATTGVGTAPGASASFTWTAGPAGSYAIACLIPGHETAGMWLTLKVTTGGTPSISG